MSGGNWKEMFSAASEGNLLWVKYHVKHGADVNYVHPEILGTALVASLLAQHEPVAMFLLESGANPNLLSEFEGLTPLQAARKSGLTGVEMKLLELGAQEPAVEAAPITPAAPASWFSRSGRGQPSSGKLQMSNTFETSLPGCAGSTRAARVEEKLLSPLTHVRSTAGA